MKTIQDKRDAAAAMAQERAAENEAGMKLIAQHFSTPEGRKVFELLARRFGLLGPCFRVNDRGEVNAVRAGIRDGEANVLRFILECLAKSGANSINLPL